MFGETNRLLVAAVIVAVAVLVAPAAAVASCGGGPSAENVYKECLPSGGGGKPTGPATSSSPSSSSPTASSEGLSQRALQALNHSGKDKAVLSALVRSYGLQRHLQAAHASDGGARPSALGSAFDLGSGPTVLLIVLAGTAALLLGGSGMRVWRSRQRP